MPRFATVCKSLLIGALFCSSISALDGLVAEPNVELVVTKRFEGAVLTIQSSGAEGNKYGFEGGRVLKLNGAYHLFTSEMIGDPHWVKMRLAELARPGSFALEAACAPGRIERRLSREGSARRFVVSPAGLQPHRQSLELVLCCLSSGSGYGAAVADQPRRKNLARRVQHPGCRGNRRPLH